MQRTLLLLAAAASLPAEALACGGFFCDNNQPIDQAAEQIVFAVDTDQGTVDLDDVGVGIDPVPEHGNPTVHRHPTRGDHLLDHAAAGDTASREHLLQPHRRHVGRRFGHRPTRSRRAGR